MLSHGQLAPSLRHHVSASQPLTQSHTSETQAIEMHSPFQRADKPTESQEYYGSQWILSFCRGDCAFL